MKHTIFSFSRKKDSHRIWEIDFLRGLAIVIVILYHLCWSFMVLVYAFSNHAEILATHPNLSAFCDWLVYGILNNPFLHTYIVPLVGGLFIFVCGVSSTFSHSNLKRALLLWIFALAVSIATMVVSYVLNEDLFIDFGVLHLMALALTVYGLLELLFHTWQKPVPFWLVSLIALLVFFVSLMLSSGYCPLTDAFFDPFAVGSVRGIALEKYSTDPLYWFKEAIGYYEGTVDWWPIFPYFGVLFAGIAFGKAAYQKHQKSLLPAAENWLVFKPVCFVGRHTLLIYLLHQPIIIGILFVLFSIIGFRI